MCGSSFQSRKQSIPICWFVSTHSTISIFSLCYYHQCLQTVLLFPLIRLSPTTEAKIHGSATLWQLNVSVFFPSMSLNPLSWQRSSILWWIRHLGEHSRAWWGSISFAVCIVHFQEAGAVLPLSGALLQLLRIGISGHTELRLEVGPVYVIANSSCYFQIKNVESLCKDLEKKASACFSIQLAGYCSVWTESA